jgi:5-methylcytosine-specific restriction endonuclease McrA
MTTAELRLQLLERSKFRCECGGPDFKGCTRPAAELDHFFGRARAPESAETCWMLATECHRAKTDGEGGAAEWLYRFMEHCARHDYREAFEQASKRSDFVRQRDAFRQKTERR